jgi:hypothetical protein
MIASVLALLVTSTPSQAVPDWRKDGRLGYPTRELALKVARAFTAPGAPREGRGFRIRRDPDGGFTPIFHERIPPGEAGA